MNEQKIKRGHLKGCITRSETFARAIDDRVTIEMLEIQRQKLEEAWSDFNEIHCALLMLSGTKDFVDPEPDFVEYESKYFYAQSTISKAIRERKHVGETSDHLVVEKLADQQASFLEKLNSSSHPKTIKLPAMNIEEFSGDFKDWPSFKDQFTGSIDLNKDLTAVQKFRYLKSLLRGDAADLIKHIRVTEANYIDAWDRLEERYNRKKLISQSFINMFLSLPSVTGSNVNALRKVTDSADEVIRGLSALESTGRDPWLTFILVDKLDNDTKRAWAGKTSSDKENTIDELLSFLKARCNALESCQPVARLLPSRSKPHGSNIKAHFAETPQAKATCPKCKENHYLPQCSKFIALDIESRRTFVKSNTLSFNCLRSGHPSYRCHSASRCRVCKSRHHSLVHPPDQNTPSSFLSSSPVKQSSSSSNSLDSAAGSSSLVPQIISNHSLKNCCSKQTILPTILATVKNRQGIPVYCRVLIDTGSQVSFVVESFVQKLGINRTHARIPITGLSASEAGHTKGRVSISLCSRFNDNTQLSIDAFILCKVTSNLPSSPFDISSWNHIQNLELADPFFNVPGSIDVLLGADRLWNILEAGQIRGSQGIPIAQQTSFGWIVAGELLESRPSVSSLHASLDVDSLLQKFWEIEEVTLPTVHSVCDDEAESHFVETFSRAPDGKYVVQLPFKNPTPVFVNSYRSAVSRLYAMERRFTTDPVLKQLYSTFMKEYYDLGHMTAISPADLKDTTRSHFYLPHHAVLKPDSKTTKLRVVFDGSAKDSQGNSLNSSLLIGPPIQRDLFGVCLRFREHRFVFTADVVKMFRQIWVADEHTDFQRILWRANPSDEIQHFRLRTVTYGTASAPFLSVRVLQQLAQDYRTIYPNASRVLLRDVYVDDIMTGADCQETLISLQTELVALLSEAKLELRKWNSNSWTLLATLPKEECDFSWVDTERSKSLIKVLGMYWNPPSDNFSFKMTERLPTLTPTRRTLLSEISRIFDPLGLLAPSVILVKMLFQELWSSEHKLTWDDPLPSQLADKWSCYRKELHFFDQIQVPRYLFASLEYIELHGFCDASSLAYSAVVYTRTKTATGEYICRLIAAKTKVAPLKPVSVPRLELCGALLLCRLVHNITASLTTKFTNVFAWCDSEVVLHWLSSPPRRWTTFVANRTAAILDEIPRHSWHHIPSESNPADCASRGILPSKLPTHHLWWTGPSWLPLERVHWPTSKLSVLKSSSSEIVAEERSTAKIALVVNTDLNRLQYIVEKSSSWNSLQRIVAYCIRFVSNCRIKSVNKANRIIGELKFSEIQLARNSIFKHVQLISFDEEISHLAKHKTLPPKSKLLKYAAFLDKNGILRVGGRIKHANVSFSLKHPILLDNNHLSSLIATQLHVNNLHTGVTETFVLVRQQYWILGSRNLNRKIVHKCNKCFMQRKLTSHQLMGDLPIQRITPSRPFSNTGCDYAGPFTIKLSKGRNPKMSKAYFAIFVCMSTKAMHLELVSDLTTDAFLAALRRFVSRRGKCSNIYSDNGTNFQGARRCLDDMHKLVLSQAHNDCIATALAMDGISWHFIPPATPHFGGLWEAGVRSIKLHLRRVVGSSILTFEELYTVLTQIEAILNSRPLCSISDEDLNPLTPSHFLIGEPHSAVPEPNLLDIPINRLSHWNHLQNMVQGFWKRWQKEYITTLQVRPKWQKSTDNVKPGDLVVVKEPNLPPTKWFLGRVTTVHPGPDGLVRVATLQTSKGLFVRPITKLAALPTS